MPRILMEVFQSKILEGLITFGRWDVHIPRYKCGHYCATYQQAGTFIVGVHCMAHCTNLDVQTLSGFRGGETYRGSFGNTSFNSSPEKTLEFQKVATRLESKGKQILRDLKTNWISMLGPTKRVFEEYKVLVMKMAVDAPKEPTIKKIYPCS